MSQVNEDGSAQSLEWHMLGRDRVGDVMIFNEWVVVGIVPRGSPLVLEVRLPNRATGLAAVIYSGHTRDAAFRPGEARSHFDGPPRLAACGNKHR